MGSPLVSRMAHSLGAISLVVLRPLPRLAFCFSAGSADGFAGAHAHGPLVPLMALRALMRMAHCFWAGFADGFRAALASGLEWRLSSRLVVRGRLGHGAALGQILRPDSAWDALPAPVGGFLSELGGIIRRFGFSIIYHINACPVP